MGEVHEHGEEKSLVKNYYTNALKHEVRMEEDFVSN